MIAMMEKQSKGTLKDAERKEWGEFLRKRDLSPSIYNQKVFSHKHPTDKGDYTVDIKRRGREILIEVFSK